jgi:N-acetylglucosamine kinase-like BadF-type ATPase
MSDLLLAVDGGNSKTDLVLFAADGTVLAAARRPTVSHQQVGLEEAGRRLRQQVEALAAGAGRSATGPIASLGVLCLAGMDLPSDERALTRVHARTGIAAALVLENDTVAGLRAGSPEGWGVGVVVGEGINGVGIAPDGRRARFAGLGSISGDRGGGGSLGMEALGAAVRAQDGRGGRTSLETLVPAHFGLRRPLDVTAALYAGRILEERTSELAAVAVGAARDGDAVALELVGALADECASFAIAAIRRLRLGRRAVPVVLSGGVARGARDLLADAVAERVARTAPLASVAVLEAPPVLGAALLALDRVAPGDAAAAGRVRDSITHEEILAGG